MLSVAISPTSDMRSCDMRIALINYIVSRQRGEQFALCMQNLDSTNIVEGKDQEILDLLKRFAIEQDQLFYQSDALGRYQQFALSLLQGGKAFACICSDMGSSNFCGGDCHHGQKELAKRIKEEKLSFVVRIKAPDTSIHFDDVLQGEQTAAPEDLGHLVILETNGIPSSYFATACDEMLTDTSLVIRSDTHLSDTAKEIHCKQTLGYTTPASYAHLPALGTDDQRGDTIKGLLEEGFLLDAIINYLLTLGYDTPTDVFTLPEAITWFELKGLSVLPSQMELDTLRKLNQKHLLAMDDLTLSKVFGFADADIGKLLKLFLDNASTINELDNILKDIFAPKACEGAHQAQMREIAALIQDAPMLYTFEAFEQYLLERSGLEKTELLPLLSLLLTGAPSGVKPHRVFPYIKSYITEIARCTS